MLQQVAWTVTLSLVFLLFLFFALVFLSSKRKEEYAPIIKKWYSARTWYFWSIVTTMVIVSFFTLSSLPYGMPHEQQAAAANYKSVDVMAAQFSWTLSSEDFTEGDNVKFNVTSKDVNHGFGVYDENMNLLGQVQAMPGYTNEIYLTFKTPGTYKILCLEYCSLGHHAMIKDIVVKPKGGATNGK